MTKQISDHAAAAKAIRNELKKQNVKGSVRASAYAGGSSVRVNVEQDLTPEAYQSIKTFCKQFEMGHFDGMTDMYEYSNVDSDRPQVKFVFVSISYSYELVEAVKDYVSSINGIDFNQRDQYESMVIAGTWGDFWASR